MRSMEKNVPERNISGNMIIVDALDADSSLFSIAAKIMPRPTNVMVPVSTSATVRMSMFTWMPKIT